MKNLKHYINLTRINRPTGILLLALPCLFGFFLASKSVESFDIKYPLLFLFGAVIMRSAGCIINDIFDVEFDRRVARTKERPLAKGTVSMFGAIFLLALLSFFGLLILIQFNKQVIFSGIIAAILVAFYPLMKRITFYPQIFLGLAFNYGILMADLQLHRSIHNSTILLYLAAIVWTLIYDSIYAFQDIEDDMKIGVKSSAIKFKNEPKKTFMNFSILMFSLLAGSGYLQDLALHFYITLFLAFCYLNYIILTCDYSNPKKCLKVFRENVFVGILILFAIILG